LKFIHKVRNTKRKTKFDFFHCGVVALFTSVGSGVVVALFTSVGSGGVVALFTSVGSGGVVALFTSVGSGGVVALFTSVRSGEFVIYEHILPLSKNSRIFCYSCQ
jgi:amino acid permease